MKYIFDFDDVLFYTTKMLKKHMYTCLQEAGISRETAERYYKTAREKEFSLKKSIAGIFANEKKNKNDVEKIYEKIMSECKNFTNSVLIEKIKKLGREDCFIITNGEEEFQKDKIARSGIAPFFSEIYIVPESKKEIIYNLCNKYDEEEIIFTEDKIRFIEDIDLKKCPNLKTILYRI